jgi:hypothetical protein
MNKVLYAGIFQKRIRLSAELFDRLEYALNTAYMTDSYIGFTLKMESVTKNTIVGLKMIVKSGLEKFILKSLHAGR